METINERLLKVQEVSLMIDSSIQTINGWYRWKDIHPEHELAQLLPEFVRQGGKNTRYWKQSDVWKLIQFKKSIKQGRDGIMGDITQKYVKKKDKKENNANE